MKGTNHYELSFIAIQERPDGHGRLFITVNRGREQGAYAFYIAPAVVSESFLKANLGPLGRVDLALRLSGREREIDLKCSEQSYPFEPGTYEGTIEFNGEGGYTAVNATEAKLRPPVTSFCGSGGGYGESSGPGVPGARIRGISFLHDRKLSFQVNKNGRRGRTLYTADLTERRGKVVIVRGVKGFASPAAFRFESDLSKATLTPPSPFSGSATLVRRPGRLLPSWSGDLSASFPGRPNVRLTGPGVHVNLVHACFQIFDGPRAHTC